MHQPGKKISTGLEELDAILDGLRLGDNVVWSIDRITDYQRFVTPFVRAALKDRRRLVYLRYAHHPPLVEGHPDATLYELDADRGFEWFAARVHQIIRQEGQGTFYVFDCLSDLLTAWATDLMVGNFFRITCPFLYQLETIGYFALIRNNHSFKTMARIRETTQVMLAIHPFRGDILVQPVKVWKRRSPTMFLPHLRQGQTFVPVAASGEATQLVSQMDYKGTGDARRHLDFWDRLFLEAEELIRSPDLPEAQTAMVDKLCRVLIGREPRILSLARTHFTLQDLVALKSRLIGTGFIGGKAAGMLLARKVLVNASPEWGRHLEAHDSFYIGTDVFYSYLVHNGLWELLMRQKTPDNYFEAAAELRDKILQGAFPEEVREELQRMLEYFGQYPVIVRSSSLLEDSFGNAFAGKYDSVFCVNQGSPEERGRQIEEAIRQVFASAMNPEALAYRCQRGLGQQEEQIALLLQRVSGAYRGYYYFPDLSGVGVSYNTFVWSRGMKPQAGMLRLVLGLGTRAVDRIEGDYARLVALDAPLKQPHSTLDEKRRFSQHNVDVLDVNENRFQTIPLSDLEREHLDLPWEFFATPDRQMSDERLDRGKPDQRSGILTFDRLLSETDFLPLMQRMLKTLEQVYEYPVDIEFTANFLPDGSPRINLVQCRPLQTKGREGRIEFPKIESSRILFQSEGHFMGGSLLQPIHWILWINPERYQALSLSEQYETARIVGRLNRRLTPRQDNPALLLGPGRWGTSTPSLGVPVRFSEINNIAVLGEIAFPGSRIVPELSFGTHFFQDLVEADIFYLALFPDQPEVRLNRDWFESLPNLLGELVPGAERLCQTIRCADVSGENVWVMADVVSQKLLCARRPREG